MSINSTLGMISMADKMSVSQLQQAVRDGSVPAYIAVPLMQERMKQQKEAQALAMAHQQKQPPVAQQVMQEAGQQEVAPQEAIAGLPTQEQAYAPGGIVAFAGGDLVDDDQEAYDEALEDEMFNDYVKALAGKTGAHAAVNRTPATGLGYGDVQGAAPAAARGQMTGEPRKGLDSLVHPFEQQIRDEAKRQGRDPEVMLKLAKLETGGHRDPANAVSPAGAQGIFQLMPGTAKSLGVTDPFDAKQNIRAGIQYMGQQQDRFKNDRLAAAAFNAGPGNVNKYGGVPPFKETQNYASNFKEGGIAQFAAGKMVDIGGKQYEETDDPDYVMADGVRTSRNLVEQSAQSPWNNRGMTYPSVTDGLGTDLKTGAIKTGAAAADVIRYPLYAVDRAFGSPLMDKSATPFYDKYVRQAGLDPEPSAVKPSTLDAAQAEAQKQKTNKYPDESRLANTIPQHFSGDQTAPAAPVAAPAIGEAPTSTSPWDDLLANIKKSRESAAQSAQQDKWMGLLGAGLGMMGGTSPYAMQNIGQGAMYGLGQYSQARKASAAEQAAIDKQEATALRYKSMDEYYKDKLEGTADQKKREAERQEYTAASGVMDRLYKGRVEEAKAIFGKPEMWDAATQKKAMDFINQIKQDKQYIDAQRRLGQLGDFEVIRQRPAA